MELHQFKSVCNYFTIIWTDIHTTQDLPLVQWRGGSEEGKTMLSQWLRTVSAVELC